MTNRLSRSILVVVLLVSFCGIALAARTCPECRTSNPDNAKFCKNCGYRFPARTPSPSRPRLGGDVEVDGNDVRITSTPSGAAVSLDGRERGTTPLTIRDLDPGRHEVELSRSGYRDYSRTFTIAQPKGMIVVTTEPPGAEILLDGQRVGVTTDSGLVLREVYSGSHRVLARRAGYDDEERTVELTSSSPVGLVTVKLLATGGFLSVRSDPRGATVFVDNEKKGVSAYVGKFPPAQYDLRLTMPGFNDWQERVEVRLADTTNVVATLELIRIRKPGLLWGGVAGVAVGAVAALVGELTYSRYKDAQPPEYTPDEIGAMHTSTVVYDWLRNIAGTAGALSLGAYFVF